jgi:4,5-DOPA dioxygenase extradiol
LREEGVLLVASGNVVHNLALWREAAGTRPGWAEDFRARSNAAILAGDDRALIGFATSSDPAAAKAINSGEHFLPLLYAVGARLPGDGAALFNDTLDGALSMTSVLIGDPALLSGTA